MGAIDRLLHRNPAAKTIGDVATTGTAGAASGMMGLVYRPRIMRLEDRLLLNAVPEAAVEDLPEDQMINEDFQFTVSFDNNADTTDGDPNDTGYGPFVDVTVGSGIEVNNVTYLGSSVQSQEVGTWDGSQWVDGSGNPITQHPLDTVGGQLELPEGSIEGETWINVLAPFGSYTPDQPAIDLVFSATMEESPDADPETGAVPGTDIIVTASGGFRFGEDALDNPDTDPPLQQDTAQTDTVTPIVMRLEKDVQLPENETAQGPNFTFTYTISVDIADGVTLENLVIQDLLPTNLYFLNAEDPDADAIVAPGVDGQPQGVPGTDPLVVTEATFTYDMVTGVAGGGDLVITLTAYAPKFSANGTEFPQIDENNPESYTASNQATVESGVYVAPNGVDVPIDDNIADLEDNFVTITIRPYTVLKTATIEGGGDAAPGKYVQYEIDIDVSDYLALNEGVLTDILADGLELDTTDDATLDHTPVLRVEMNGEVYLFQLSTTPPPGDAIELEAAIQGDGTQHVTFYLSNAVSNAGATDATLFGDLFNGDAQEGPTSMTLTYFALINETYRVKGGGTAPVVVNDRLTNTVSLTLNSATPNGGAAQADGSGDEVVIDPPQSSKTLYAVNGDQDAPPEIAPGDLVTYRIRIEVGSADVDDLVITDYLPSPIYDVDAGAFVFVDGGSGIPGAYQVFLGPDDTLSGTDVVGNPGVTVDPASNSIIFTYGSFDEEASQGGVIDLIYTIQVLDEPFADGLLLTNQAVIETANSDAVIADDVIINDVTFHQPVLSVTKGAVATDANGAVDDSLAFTPGQTNPNNVDFAVGTPGFTGSVTADDLAAAPIDSDMSGFDGGDTVKFAVTVQNTGGEDAFDVVINDMLPDGFEIPDGAVLTVQYGDGTVVSFTGDINDFFGAGITINDNGGVGGIAAAGDADGHDIIIISYELVAADDVNPGVTVENTAEIVSFAALEGGTDFTEGVTGDFTDEAAVTAQGVAVQKTLFDTDQDFTNGDDLTIGEIGTFQIEVTVPDGTTDATITDALPDGFQLVSGTLVLRLGSFEGTVSQNGVVLADGAVLDFTAGPGNDFTILFDEIIANAAPGTDLSGQSFIIEYQAQALDDEALDSGTRATNTATLDTTTTDPVSDTAGVDIVEPNLTITKTFTPDEAQANETVGMTLEIANGTGTFDTTSFGLELTDDDLPLDIFSNVVSVSVTGTGNVDTDLVTVTIDDTSDPDNWVITVTADPTFAIAKGEKLTLEFGLTVDPDVGLGTMVDNTATIESYSSLSGEQLIERIFGPETGSDTLTISGPTIQKYLLNTSLGGQPIDFPLPAELPVDTTGLDADPNVAVGEVLTYGLQIAFPRGDAGNVIVFDDTDFLNALGAQGIVSIVSVDQLLIGDSLTLDAPLTVADVQILDPDGDGIFNRLEFTIGEVNNDAGDIDPDTPVDVVAESIFIVFRAQVMNVPETDGGDEHLNGARVTYQTDSNGDGVIDDNDDTLQFDDQVQITVDEPAIDVAKSVTGDGPDLDAGDELTYTLTLSHDDALSTGDGYALTLTDVLPDDLEFVDGSVIVEGFTAEGFDGEPEVSFDAGTNTLTVSGFDLPQGQTVTITYRAVVSEAVIEGETLTNNVTLTYQSLPDVDPVDGLDPSIPDGIDSESQTRDGSDMIPRDQDDPMLVNNYFFETAQTVEIADPGPITKTVDKPTATIGEIVTYTLEIPLIEGTTAGASVTDTLPPGVTFLSGTVFNGDGDPIDPALFTFTQVGQTLTIVANDDFVTAGDNEMSNDFIRITFQARVDNVFDNENNDAKVNLAEWTHDNGGSSDDATFTVVEPNLVLTKENDAPATVDGGDEITFTITASHSGSSTADAFEFTFTDQIPEDFEATLVSATVDGVDVSGEIEIVGNTIQTVDGADIDIPLGATFTLVYAVVVQDSVGPNETISNTVAGRWSSLDGDVSPGTPTGERIGTLVRDVNDYVTSADAQVVTDNSIQLVKTADVEEATIGETVTYTLDITVFEGTLQNVVVQDLTQPGLEIDPDSLDIVTPSEFAGIAGLEIVEGSVTLVPSDLVPGAFLLSFQIQNSADGTLVNPGDNDAGTDTFSITYTAVVVNELINQDGGQIDNAAGVQADGTPLATGAESIALVEPELTIDKTVVSPAGPVDAGDVITYQVVLTNIGTSTAFDVTFTDGAPLNTLFTGTVTAVDGGGGVGTFTISPDGTTLTGSDFDIAVGGTVTLTFTVTVQDTVAPGNSIDNGATVRWTSTAGDDENERTGADGHTDDSFDDDGPDDTDDTLNNYEATDTVTVETDFTVDVEKELVASSVTDTAGSALTIGETATFNVNVTLTEGSTPNVVVVDQLPDNFEYVDGTFTVDAPAGTLFDGAATLPPTAFVYDEVANTITITLGTVTIPGTDDTTDGAPDTAVITFGYQGVMLNELPNQDSVVLENAVTVTTGAPELETPTDSVEMTLVEPDITADKTVLPFDEMTDAGDTITYEVLLTNTGNSTAFDIELTDIAPTNTTFVPGSVTIVDEDGNPISATITLSPDNSTLTISGFDLAVGASITMNYDLLLGDAVEPGDMLTNDMEATWTSTPGANANERTGDDGPGGALDDYAVADSETIEIGPLPLTVDKRVADSSVDATDGSDVAVGEIVTFAVRVNIPEGTVRGFDLVDVLPDGQRFLPGTVQVVPGNPDFAFSVGNAVYDPDTNTLTVTGITVINPGDNDLTNNFVDIFYQVVIVDEAGIVEDGEVLPNTVTVTSSTGAQDSATAEVNVVEPDLVIEKTVDEEFVAMGDTASYTITVQHSPDSIDDEVAVDAFDVVIEDPFDDPFMVLDLDSVTAEIVGAPLGTPAPVVQIVGSGFRITADVLPVGASIVINFNAEAVVENAANGSASLNTSSLTYDTIPGTDDPDEQRTYTDEDDATVTIAGPDLRVIKDASQNIVEVGGMYSYTIQVLNKGAPGVDAGNIEQANNVVLTDTLPEDITLLAVTVNGVDTPFTVNPDTNQFSIALGTLEPEETVTIVLTVQVADVLSPVTEEGGRNILLVNEATATMDEPEPTPEDNTDDAIVIPEADGRPPVPDLEIEKTNDVEETGGSETVPFTITARNVGDRVAAGVQIVDHVDTNVFEFVSADRGGVYDAASGTVTWHLDTLSPDDGDQVFTMVLRVKPGLPASVDETTNLIDINDNGFGGRDPTPENNHDEHTDRLIYPDLVVTKASAVEEVSPGDVIDYAITVRNIGDFRADGVVVRDFVDPRIFRFVSATNGGVFDPATNIVTWNLGTVAPGQATITLGLTLEVLFPSQADIDQAVNVIEVDGDGTTGLDSDPTNNIDTEVDILNALPDPAEIARVLGEDEDEEEEEIEVPIYVAPFFTGTAAIGATVTVTLYSADGLPLDTGSTVVGPSGNWMLSMDDVKGPAPVSAIVMTSPPKLTPLGALDHTNVQYNPGATTPIPFQRHFDIFGANDLEAGIVLKDQMAASQDPLGISSRRYINYNAPTGSAIGEY
ncbi:isopeptide-forming domain-containing fimbrial protein [Mesorhizobium xinjiangense]|uniref:isopeptide-forming domain-containing fimbrial protein n=1 Tax=Mesorhizobium xinjiangense TaxID=2678685 RepID=UPI0012ED47BD|nr:isopeptide-forming domain-containing fimbrial protein [Mesorhizobium xinjiangense]